MKQAFETIIRIAKKIASYPVFWYAVVGFVIYLTWKRLSKPKEETFRDTPLPNSGTGIPVGWLPDSLALKFHDYFDSWLSNSTKLELAYKEANVLTNDQFVALVKTYNSKYAKIDGNITLWTRVKGWKSIWFGSGTDDQNNFYQKMIDLKQDY